MSNAYHACRLERVSLASHYGHKSIPDAKFESDRSSSFGDMTSQNFPRKREQVMKFGYLPPPPKRV